MSERPILFSAPMVRAILDGRKTMTRRVLHYSDDVRGATWARKGGGGLDADLWAPCDDLLCRGVLDAIGPPVRCPYPAGARLWVREPARVIGRGPVTRRADTIRVRYEADGAESGLLPFPERLRFDPTIGRTLPRGTYREASRILLAVESVRVERLQDITVADARAEGIPQTAAEAQALGLIDLSVTPGHEWDNRTSVENYARLWDHINGKRAPWAANPWVWCITFRRVGAP